MATGPGQMTGPGLAAGNIPGAQEWANFLERKFGDAVVEVMRIRNSGREVVGPVIAVDKAYADSKFWHTIDLARKIKADD